MSHKIRYTRPFTFLFSYSEWGNRLLIGTLVMLIPVVGNLMVQGWGVKVMHRRIRGDEGLPEFNDLGELLRLGLVPFLVQLLTMLPMMLLTFMGMGAMFAIVGGFGAAMGPEGQEPEPWVMGVMIASMLGIGGMISLCSFAMSVPMQVALLRADVTGDLKEAFNVSEVIAMSKAMFKPILIGSLVMGLIAPVVILTGELMCLIGIYPALFIVINAGHELRTQIYRAWLANGNTPIAETSFIDGDVLALGPEI